MVRHKIILGHEISKKGIEVDRAKIEDITKLPMLKCVKDIRSFLGYAGSAEDLSRTLGRLLDP